LLSAMTARAAEARPSALDVAVAARALEHDKEASEVRLDRAPATRVAGPAPTLLTVPLDAHASGATAIMPTAVIEQLGRDAAERAAERADIAGSTVAGHAGRLRRPLVLAVVGLLVLIAAVVAVPRIAGTPRSTAPTVATVVEPLGTDLKALMTSVSP
ncbi:MAG TPA: hypothetical protein VIK17_01345, partial [Cellulomonas sp.]